MGREEKGDGEDRGDLREKKESQKGERVIKPIITLLPSLKVWVLLGNGLISRAEAGRVHARTQALSHPPLLTRFAVRVPCYRAKPEGPE